MRNPIDALAGLSEHCRQSAALHSNPSLIDQFNSWADALEALSVQPGAGAVADKRVYIKRLRTLVRIQSKYADQIRDWLNATPPAAQPQETLMKPTFDPDMEFSHYEDDQPVFKPKANAAPPQPEAGAVAWLISWLDGSSECSHVKRFEAEALEWAAHLQLDQTVSKIEVSPLYASPTHASGMVMVPREALAELRGDIVYFRAFGSCEASCNQSLAKIDAILSAVPQASSAQ